MKAANARAHSNIALVKYWGKRSDSPPELNLPAVGSLSMTLDALWTDTQIRPALADKFELDGAPGTPDVAQKVFVHLDRVWRATGTFKPRPCCHVVSQNHVQTAAGLASSACGFAALTFAAATAFEAKLDDTQMAGLARMGSGSAARSVFGGFVRLDRGTRTDGLDCIARPLAAVDEWPIRLLVLETTRQAKSVGSTDGMAACAATSPYYPPWVEQSCADLNDAEAALNNRNIQALGTVVEHSCFKMHAAMLATRPPLLYWNGVTVDAMRAVWAARHDGIQGYVTIDAGPHVKVLTLADHAQALQDRLRSVPGIVGMTLCKPGPAAKAVLLKEP